MQLYIYLIGLLLSLFPGDFNVNSTNVISVTITGIKDDKGNIRLGVYKNSETFPITGKQYKGYVIEVKNKKASIQINNLPPGKYAIATIHDVNANEILDKNYIGYPLEPYGFSNNARGKFSAPSFESASFWHDGTTHLTIKVY